MRFEDRGGLERCSAAMSTAPANDPTVISVKWGLAVRAHDKARALALVEEARKAGVDYKTLNKMSQTTNAMTRNRFQKAAVLGVLGNSWRRRGVPRRSVVGVEPTAKRQPITSLT